MSAPFTPLDQLAVNTIRTLSIDAVQKANSGHPGLPLGAAPMAYVLWQRYLKHNPKDPRWPDRDRFVLSAGHGCMLHYTLLHLTGYDLSMDDLKAFRQWGSKTPGHPETLDGAGAGRPWLVCALVVPADRAFGLASVFADQSGLQVSATREDTVRLVD